MNIPPSVLRWILVCGFVEAAILFLVVPFFTHHFPELYSINRFPDGYDKLAENILAGHGYRFFPDTSETLMRTPGYPLFLAGIFYFFPGSLTAVKMVNLVLTLLTAWLVVCLMQRFTDSKMALFFSSTLFLIHPGVILAQSRGGVEILFTFLMAGLALALCRAFDRQENSDFLVVGMLLGLMAMVKSTIILLPPFFCVCLFAIEKWNSVVRVWFPKFTLMIGVMMMVLLPWIARNYVLVNQFIPTMTVAGTAASHGLYACKNFSFNGNTGRQFSEAARQLDVLATQLNLPHRSGYFQYFFDEKDEVRFNRYLLKLVFDEYRRSPSLLLRCSFQNVFSFWFAGRMWQSTILNLLVQFPYLIFSCLGIYILTKQSKIRQVFPFLVIGVYFLFSHLPIIALARYSIPLVPFLALFSGLALDQLRVGFSKSPNQATSESS